MLYKTNIRNWLNQAPEMSSNARKIGPIESFFEEVPKEGFWEIMSHLPMIVMGRWLRNKDEHNWCRGLPPLKMRFIAAILREWNKHLRRMKKKFWLKNKYHSSHNSNIFLAKVSQLADLIQNVWFALLIIMMLLLNSLKKN
jgi:hypothetical protein